jgi:uncharacterized membrane protein YqaE (UPF0057 family)
MGSARTCTATLLALFLPPVAVALQCGCGCQLCINILLTLLGFLPGVLLHMSMRCACTAAAWVLQPKLLHNVH